MPWDVVQGVRQRVAALSTPAQSVLGVASVAERVVPRSLLLRVVGRPEDEVLFALEGACRSGLLAERGEHDYQVTHDVIREVVEADLGAARRTALHRQIALALVDMPGESPVEEVAYHFARTDEHDEAARWLEQAGDAAAARFATASAMEQYLAACERAPAGDVGLPNLSRLHGKLGALHVLMGEFSRAREAYAAAMTYSSNDGSAMEDETAARRAELRRKAGDTWEKQGEYAQALAAFDAAEAEGGRDGAGLPDRLRAEIELSRGAVYHRQGSNDAAAAAADRAVDFLSLETSDGPAAQALARAFNLQGNLALHRGDLVQAEELYRRGLDLRERIGDQQGSAYSWNNVGRVAFRRGDLTRAEECFQRALDVNERIGDQQASAGGWHNLGAAARDRGDLARAEECHQRCLEISDRIGDTKLQEHSWHSLGIVAHDRGDLARADDCFQRSLTISDRIGDVYTSAHTWHQLGVVARDRGDLDRADDWVDRSLTLFERLGDEHGRADCWTTLGLIAGERGDVTISA